MASSERIPLIGRRKSITRRILLPVVILILASNAVVLSIIMRQLDTQLLAAAEQNLINESELQAVQFRANMLELIRDLQFLVGTPPIQGLIRAEQHEGVDPFDGSTEQEWQARLGVIFTELLKTKPKLQIRYIRNNGHEFIRADRSGPNGSVRVVAESELQDKSRSRYFIETRDLAAGEIYLSKIELNREFDKVVNPPQPVIRAATPIFGSDGSLFGIVVINHNLQISFDNIKALTRVEHPVLIANEAGEYLVHPQAGRSFAFEYGRTSNVAEDFPAVKQLVARPELEVLTGLARINNSELIYALRSVAYNPYNSRDRLILVSSNNFQDALVIKDQLLSKIYLFLTFVLLLALVLAVYVSRRVSGPIIAMRNALKRGGLKTRSEDLPIDDGGELGELARVFDELLQELSRRQQLLESEVIERKTTSLALAKNNQKLASNNRELEQFTYIASHDLQEPLRTVQSFVELFEQNYSAELDDQAKVFLGFINESTARMTTLIKGLLDYGRLGTESEFSQVNCNEVVADVCADLALRLADVGGVVEYSGLPLIQSRRIELRLLFQNLISNGLKFSRDGVAPKIIISAEKSGDFWTFSVSDNGIGIGAENYQRIFMIFQRLHARDKYDGSGIGLAHCKKIVELHGGEIWLESELNQGSVFYFTLRDQ